MQSSRFRKVLSGLFLGAILLIGANAWLAFHAEQVLATAEGWVTHTLQVITMLERTLHHSNDMEWYARGYMMTGEARFLDAYKKAVSALPTQYARLEQLTADNPEQVARLQQMDALTQKEAALLQGYIDRGPKDLVAQHRAFNETEAALDLMLNLNSIVTEAERNEHVLLTDRLKGVAIARNEAKITVAVASSLDVLFIVLAYWLLGYERRMRERARQTAERLEKLKNISDVAMGQLPLHEMTREILMRLKASVQADAVALYGCAATQIEDGIVVSTTLSLVDALGIEFAPGPSFELAPESQLARATSMTQVIRLTGHAVHALPDHHFSGEMGTLLLLPLVSRGHLLGFLVAGHVRQEAFSQLDEELLQLVADRVATGMDRAQLFEKEREARQAAERNAAEVQALNEELEGRVRQRTAELETTNRELEAFSYSVSHDLRAPLRSVDGFSVALAEDYGEQLQGDGAHYLSRIRAGVQRMGQLIDALLQLSRITRAEITPEPSELSAVAQSVADDLLQALPGRDLRIEVEPGLHANCDPHLMRVVFENMFGNAIKFTSKVPEARVRFGWSPEQKAYFIADNGAGFDQQYAGKLFVAFQRLHGDKDFQGSGIGLATVARVIRRHHGKMWAEGIVGQGATFWFTLVADPL